MNNRMTKIITIWVIMSMLLSLVACGAKVDDVSQKMIDDINSLGDITIDDEEQINKLIDRYSTLTDDQKKMVKNYATLLDAQDRVEELKKEQVANQEKYEQEFLAEENVKICFDVIREIKSNLKHPDTLELKKILNRDYDSGDHMCTEYYIEYEAANDLGGIVNSVVFAVVPKGGKQAGHIFYYDKDSGYLKDMYSDQMTHWNNVIANDPSSITNFDVSIIQNNS